MANLDPKELERREHNKKVREAQKKYASQQKGYKKQVREDRRELETQVSQDILKIIEEIIERQNKGVPLSEFQKSLINSLHTSFKNLDQDEKRRPRLLLGEDGMYIKDMRVLTPDGDTNFTDFKTPDAYENQKMDTLLPLGENTEDIIKMITDTISENARLIELLNEKNNIKQEKSKRVRYSEKVRANRDSFEHKILDAREIALNKKTKNSKTINLLLKEVLNKYNAAKDSTLTPLTDGYRHWIGNVPITNHGDVENLDPKADTISAATARKEMFKVDYKLPDDVALVQMLPKNITEELIRVLSLAVQENSELHNALYQKEKIQRKFPTKLVSILLALALAAGAAYGLHKIFGEKDNVNPDDQVKIEDVVEDTNEEEMVWFSPESIKYRIESAELNVDQMIAYRINIESNKQANDIYTESVNNYGQTLDEQAKNYLGSGYEKLQYNEMVAKCKDVLNTLQSQETTDFINKLIDKYENKKAVGDEQYRNQGRLSSFDLTQEEYDLYLKLYDYANDFDSLTYNIQGDILTNKDFQKILEDANVSITEQGMKRIALNAAMLLGGGALGAGIAVVVSRAKKRKDRELEGEKEEDKGV